MKTDIEKIELLNKIVTAFDEHASLLKYAISKGEEWDYQTLAEAHTAYSEIKSMLISNADLTNNEHNFEI